MKHIPCVKRKYDLSKPALPMHSTVGKSEREVLINSGVINPLPSVSHFFLTQAERSLTHNVPRTWDPVGKRHVNLH